MVTKRERYLRRATRPAIDEEELAVRRASPAIQREFGNDSPHGYRCRGSKRTLSLHRRGNGQ